MTMKQEQAMALAGLFRGVTDRALSDAEVSYFMQAFEIPADMVAQVTTILQRNPGQK